MNIYCPNCERGCSEQAQSCPECGHPLTELVVLGPQFQTRTPNMAPPFIVQPLARVQTIEKTSKKWKLLMLVGSICIIGGLVSCSADPNSSWTSLLLFLGVVLVIYAKIMAWWHHG